MEDGSTIILEEITEYSDIDTMWSPKRSCPRNLGLWYCKKCKKKHLEVQSELDFPIPIAPCYKKKKDNKVCGATHLGYEWCQECINKNKRECNHFMEYEQIARLISP